MYLSKVSAICSTALLLSVSYAVETKPQPRQPPQMAEAAAQETVKLAISGMT